MKLHFLVKHYTVHTQRNLETEIILISFWIENVGLGLSSMIKVDVSLDANYMYMEETFYSKGSQVLHGCHGPSYFNYDCYFNPFLNDKFKTLPNRKSLQTTILNSVKMAESPPKGKKNTVGEKHCVTSNFSFSHSIFKRLVLQA